MSTPSMAYAIGASAAGGAVLMVAYALFCGIGPIAGIPATIIGLVNIGFAASHLRSTTMDKPCVDEHSADGWAVPWEDGLGHVRWQPQRPDGTLLWVDYDREWATNKKGFITYEKPEFYRSRRRAERVAMKAERHAIKARNARFRQVQS